MTDWQYAESTASTIRRRLYSKGGKKLSDDTDLTSVYDDWLADRVFTKGTKEVRLVFDEGDYVRYTKGVPMAWDEEREQEAQEQERARAEKVAQEAEEEARERAEDWVIQYPQYDYSDRQWVSDGLVPDTLMARMRRMIRKWVRD